MTSYDKPFTELPAPNPDLPDKTVSGSALTGYYVVDTLTGERISGPYAHWGNAFIEASRR